jgi:hypothetical protein
MYVYMYLSIYVFLWKASKVVSNGKEVTESMPSERMTQWHTNFVLVKVGPDHSQADNGVIIVVLDFFSITRYRCQVSVPTALIEDQALNDQSHFFWLPS